MIWIYRRNASTGARELAEALNGRRWRGRVVPIEQKVRRGDTVICWGESLAPIPGIRIINGTDVRNKFEDAVRLQRAGVPTIEVSRTRPTVQQQAAPVDPAIAIFNETQQLADAFSNIQSFRRTPVLATGIGELYTACTRLVTALRTPAPVAPPTTQEEWLGRLFNHTGGSDLLHPTGNPDFYAKKVNLVEEFRIHSFNEKSIRAGVKSPREGVPQHPWIRSYDGGWRILYDGFSSRKAHRELAHQAVTALGLQFGAVDIGKKPDGSLIVLEVNRAPGLEGGTVTCYANAIQRLTEAT